MLTQNSLMLPRKLEEASQKLVLAESVINLSEVRVFINVGPSRSIFGIFWTLFPKLMFSRETSVFGPRKYVGSRMKL